MTTTTTSPPPSAPALRRFASTIVDNYLPQLLITGILLVAQLGYGVLESFPKTLAAIGASVVTEVVLSLLILGRWPRLTGAYTTGISCGILVRSPAFWPYIMCGMISIMSKYALRWRGRHIWNPSNMGISAMLFLAPAAVAGLSVQWGNAVLPMVVIWILGLSITWKLRLMHITVTYIASFLAFSGLRSLLTGVPFLASISPLTGPMYQLFIFFMITDPKTTVRSKRGQAVTVFFVALVEALLRLNQVVNAPFYALFLVGPVPFIYQLWRDGDPATANRPAAVLAQPAPLTTSERPA